MSRTWSRVTSSDDVKVCDSSICVMYSMLLLYPALTIPINSNTAGVSNACIKTLLQCWHSSVLWTAPCTCPIRSDPARWTANTRRRWCCLTLVWTKSTHRRTSTVLFSAICLQRTCNRLSVLLFTASAFIYVTCIVCDDRHKVTIMISLGR